MTRLIDLMCSQHRQQVLDTRVWPGRDTTCPHCWHDSVQVRLLPNHDIMRCIAIHETGHAVAYLALGCPVTAVTVRPDATGSVDFRSDGPEPVGVWAGTAALRHMLFNGGAASQEDLLDVVATGGVGAVSDAELLHAMVRDGVDITAGRADADRLVAQHWDAIERVADALLVRGRLDGAELAVLTGLDVGRRS